MFCGLVFVALSGFCGSCYAVQVDVKQCVLQVFHCAVSEFVFVFWSDVQFVVVVLCVVVLY